MVNIFLLRSPTESGLYIFDRNFTSENLRLPIFPVQVEGFTNLQKKSRICLCDAKSPRSVALPPPFTHITSISDRPAAISAMQRYRVW